MYCGTMTITAKATGVVVVFNAALFPQTGDNLRFLIGSAEA